jgi:uncharacterized glyoxalase superfamily metalloenzyme YdcJ
MFSMAMSDMYRREVPQYGTLLELVSEINWRARLTNQAPNGSDPSDRIDVERHGAIRVGTALELKTVRRLFGVMGMSPVGYYSLSSAGVPVHSTAFRPISDDGLRRNPFRIFTSLLRLELIEDAGLRSHAAEILAKRNAFTPRCLELILQNEREGGLSLAAATQFVSEALNTFRWHSEATVSAQTYKGLKAVHPLIADVVCFRGPHINHLTPRTLAIDAAHAAMRSHGLEAKALIEGPPARQHPILLRQTSFKALQEAIDFIEPDGSRVASVHTARFGEIEQRGVALTPAGRELYDRLLAQASVHPAKDAAQAAAFNSHLTAVFRKFPDSDDAMRKHGLAYYRYRLADKFQHRPIEPETTFAALVSSGQVRCEPITYEDFLPVSAAGIFRSNLGDEAIGGVSRGGDLTAFEEALGAPVFDPFRLYAEAVTRSREACLIELGLPIDREIGVPL